MIHFNDFSDILQSLIVTVAKRAHYLRTFISGGQSWTHYLRTFFQGDNPERNICVRLFQGDNPELI